MEQSDNTARREDGESVVASTRYHTSARLVAAIHRGDEAAIREFFLLYAPLLRDQARRMDVDPDQIDEFVITLLDDVVLHLIELQIAPRHLTRYLVASLRNRARNRHRDSERRRARRQQAYTEVPASTQRVVADCHSEYGLRASTTPDGDYGFIRAPIAKLAELAARELTPDEMTMMMCVGRHVPLRDIADQLGISYVAARVRLHRLRERFRKWAIGHLGGLKPYERAELERFFRRAEVRLTGTRRQQKEVSNEGL